MLPVEIGKRVRDAGQKQEVSKGIIMAKSLESIRSTEYNRGMLVCYMSELSQPEARVLGFNPPGSEDHGIWKKSIHGK